MLEAKLFFQTIFKDKNIYYPLTLLSWWGPFYFYKTFGWGYTIFQRYHFWEGNTCFVTTIKWLRVWRWWFIAIQNLKYYPAVNFECLLTGEFVGVLQWCVWCLLQDLVPVCFKIISAQSPLPSTISDFWQMVHEQGTEVIVMLSDQHEVPNVCK